MHGTLQAIVCEDAGSVQMAESIMTTLPPDPEPMFLPPVDNASHAAISLV